MTLPLAVPAPDSLANPASVPGPTAGPRADSPTTHKLLPPAPPPGLLPDVAAQILLSSCPRFVRLHVIPGACISWQRQLAGKTDAATPGHSGGSPSPPPGSPVRSGDGADPPDVHVRISHVLPIPLPRQANIGPFVAACQVEPRLCGAAECRALDRPALAEWDVQLRAVVATKSGVWCCRLGPASDITLHLLGGLGGPFEV